MLDVHQFLTRLNGTLAANGRARVQGAVRTGAAGLGSNDKKKVGYENRRHADCFGCKSGR
jgi:hypothetical protein